MRIIGGQARGRRIVLPAGRKTRPTSDRIKEALFNLLPDVEGLRFLDLFAGTGSVGMEALSREASQTVFVENDRLCIDAIQRHLERFGLSGYRCLTVTSERGIQKLSQENECFDVIFMDPPYDAGHVGKTLLQIVAAGILAESGIVAVQHSIREPDDAAARSLMRINHRRYGDSALSFWKWR